MDIVVVVDYETMECRVYDEGEEVLPPYDIAYQAFIFQQVLKDAHCFLYRNDPYPVSTAIH